MARRHRSRRLTYGARKRARIRYMRSLGYRFVASGGLKGSGRFVRLKRLTKRQTAARRASRLRGLAKLAATFPGRR